MVTVSRQGARGLPPGRTMITKTFFIAKTLVL